MNHQHIPAGTKAQAIRRVVASKHPKLDMGSIASNMGITYQDLRVIVDQAGYPDTAKMRTAAADLELEDQRDQDDSQTTALGIQEADGAVGQLDVGSVGFEVFEKPDQDGRLTKVRVSDLHPDPDNPRDLPKVTDPDIEELADTMVEAGLLQPIVARRGDDGLLYVVAGHRRLAAAQRLKWTTVAVIVRGPMPPGDVLAAMIIENGQRKDLDPIEEARGLAHLKATEDLSDDQLARKVGRNQVHVSGRLALLLLSAEDQAAVRRGEMKLGEAKAKGRLNGGKVREKGIGRGWHLGPDHDLSQLAKNRCLRLQHSRGRTVGGMACGECWESVIRADERQHIHTISAQLGECVACHQPVERLTTEEAVSA